MLGSSADVEDKDEGADDDAVADIDATTNVDEEADEASSVSEQTNSTLKRSLLVFATVNSVPAVLQSAIELVGIQIASTLVIAALETGFIPFCGGRRIGSGALRNAGFKHLDSRVQVAPTGGSGGDTVRDRSPVDVVIETSRGYVVGCVCGVEIQAVKRIVSGRKGEPPD